MIIANTEVILTSLSSGIASMTKESDFLRHGGDMSDLNCKRIINKYYIVILQTPIIKFLICVSDTNKPKYAYNVIFLSKLAFFYI